MTKKSFTISLADWDHLISRAVIFAGRDFTMPLLRAVRLYEARGRLYAASTDRYRVAFVAAHESVEVPRGFEVLLSTQSLADLARVTKTPAKVRNLVGLTITADKETVHVSVAALPGLGDVELTLKQVEGQYPPLGRLMHTALTDTSEAVTTVAFTPAFLADYAKVAPPYTPVRIQVHGPNKPAVIRIGEDFLSALVPVRFAADDRNAGDDTLWEHLAPADEKAKAS